MSTKNRKTQRNRRAISAGAPYPSEPAAGGCQVSRL